MQICKRRQAANMTQQQLGFKMGVSQNTISDWEKEVYLPRSKQLPDLAKVLGCTIDDLYNHESSLDSSMI